MAVAYAVLVASQAIASPDNLFPELRRKALSTSAQRVDEGRPDGVLGRAWNKCSASDRRAPGGHFGPPSPRHLREGFARARTQV